MKDSTSRLSLRTIPFKVFWGFLLISGVGWLLDFTSYTVMTQWAELAPAPANFISSMIGVTYVWIVALGRLFNRGDYGRSIYLLVYWGYQAGSILAYSALIGVIFSSGLNVWVAQSLGLPAEVLAKVLLTPPNLVTNFVFMSVLTRRMKARTEE